MAETADNPHFETAESWKEAAAKVAFTPRRPQYTGGHGRQSIRVHVRDHRLRILPVSGRTLEAHYGALVLSQARPGPAEAGRRALAVSYGREPQEAEISGHAGQICELGPDPGPDDIDGRNPAVVTWHVDEMHYLIASAEMSTGVLLRIANSPYG
jgi:hypothetical protein